MPHMRDNNLEIRIAGSSCHPQLIKLIAWSRPQFPTPMEVVKIDCLGNIFLGFYEIKFNLHVRLPLLGDHLLCNHLSKTLKISQPIHYSWTLWWLTKDIWLHLYLNLYSSLVWFLLVFQISSFRSLSVPQSIFNNNLNTGVHFAIAFLLKPFLQIVGKKKKTEKIPL